MLWEIYTIYNLVEIITKKMRLKWGFQTAVVEWCEFLHFKFLIFWRGALFYSFSLQHLVIGNTAVTLRHMGRHHC